jgi:CheY-like chemotaxis protein
VTADAFVEDQTRCREAGMDEFLAKPIKLGALADVLHRCHTPTWLSVGASSL